MSQKRKLSNGGEPKKNRRSKNKKRLDSDFEILFDLYTNGKVSIDILKSCDLTYICRKCRKVYCDLEEYAVHYMKCQNSAKYVNKISNEDPNLEPLLDLADWGTPQESDHDDQENVKACSGPCIKETHSNDLGSSEGEPNAEYQVTLKEDAVRMMDLDYLVCMICDKTFDTEAEIQRHMAVVHLRFKRYRCEICEFKSNLKRKSQAHIREIHQDRVSNEFYETFSKISFKKSETNTVETKENLGFNSATKNRHGNSNKNGQGIPIDENGNCFMDNEEGQTSNGSLQVENTVPLPGSYFINFSSQQEKMIDAKGMLCLSCGKKFSRLSDLRFHLAIKHLGHSRYRCKICVFKSSSEAECVAHAVDSHHKRLKVNGKWKDKKKLMSNFWKLYCKPSQVRRTVPESKSDLMPKVFEF